MGKMLDNNLAALFPNEALSLNDIGKVVKPIAQRYNIEKVYIFGSYARGEATQTSDIDLLVIGGSNFKPTNIFAFGEDLHEAFGKDVDAYEICEIDKGTDFYNNVMNDRVLIV